MSFNLLCLSGNLAADIESKTLANGTALAATRIAVNTGWGDKKKTMFIDVTMFGKRAESFAQYCHKGSAVLLQGRLDFHQWQDKDGNKRESYGMVAENFEFMGGPREQKPAAEKQAEPEPAANDDMIPF